MNAQTVKPTTAGAGFAHHGGRLGAAQRAYPAAPQPWIDLSTGINPIAYPTPRATPEELNRLPDTQDVCRLEGLAAAVFGVPDPARVVCTPGSESALRLLPHLLGLDGVIVSGPTYGSHNDAWVRAGCAARVVPDSQVEAEIAARTALVIVNPNNPDGRVSARERLLKLYEATATRGGVLIVDEAFGEVVPGASVADVAGGQGRERLVVLRSFGKFYGLAGVRLGFAVAAPGLAARVRGVLGDWPVSADALVAGLAAYCDPEWAASARLRLERDARRLDDLLVGSGFAVLGGTSLFRLARAADALRRFEALAQAGILTRPFGHDATLLRFGIPGAEPEWLRVSAALRSSRA